MLAPPEDLVNVRFTAVHGATRGPVDNSEDHVNYLRGKKRPRSRRAREGTPPRGRGRPEGGGAQITTTNRARVMPAATTGAEPPIGVSLHEGVRHDRRRAA